MNPNIASVASLCPVSSKYFSLYHNCFILFQSIDVSSYDCKIALRGIELNDITELVSILTYHRVLYSFKFLVHDTY